MTLPIIAQTRAWFDARPRRERWILLACLLTGLIIWSSSTLGRLRAVASEFSTTGTRLATQEQILAQGPIVESQLSELLRQMEPGRTLSASRLSAELAGIGARLQLNPEIPAPRTEQVDRFLTHSTEVILRRASYEKLVSFAGEIAGRSPYLNLEQVQIIADRSNPAQLDARFRITAVELHNRQP